MSDTAQHTFNKHADRVLVDRCLAISTQRGGEYEDSWDLANMHAVWTRHTLRRFGIDHVSDREIRLIIMAALVDVKDSRMLGPWKEDTAVDGINYRAAYTGLREEYEGENALHGPTCTPENCEQVAADAMAARTTLEVP